MSGSTENRASGASEKAGGQGAAFTWNVAQRMLPLVGRIVGDVLQHRRSLTRMHLEKNRLDRNRRSLTWPERSRRYQLDEEIAAEERKMREALAELEALGVALIDPRFGQVGFPTVVNDRSAFFSWRPGEDGPQYWHFADDTDRRPVPSVWTKPAERRRGSARPGPRP
jgi:hypothetical protein